MSKKFAMLGGPAVLACRGVRLDWASVMRRHQPSFSQQSIDLLQPEDPFLELSRMHCKDCFICDSEGLTPLVDTKASGKTSSDLSDLRHTSMHLFVPAYFFIYAPWTSLDMLPGTTAKTHRRLHGCLLEAID